MELSGKVVLVTGSSHGIGKATAIAFARAGCKLIVSFNRDSKAGEAVLDECKKHSEAILIHLDVTDEKSIKKALDTSLKSFGRIEILVNNAGVLVSGYYKDQKMEDIDLQIDVNLKGMMKMTNAALPILLDQKEALIINIASGLGKQGLANYSVYCASKFGVRGFTQSIAQELPGNVGAYVVNPTGTATRMTNYSGDDPADVASLIVKVAQGKLGKRSGEDIDVWDYV